MKSERKSAVEVPGELYLSGAGIARGYRNHPELTAQSFVPNPFSADASDRLYRTGDLARLLPSGEIEFLGRSDEQVKIRGYRIEPGEIVKVLDQYAGVETSTVVARERDGGEKSLVAYLVLAARAKITATQLREHVSRQLPAYMVPASFVRVDALPVTENGKVNRSILPAPDAYQLPGGRRVHCAAHDGRTATGRNSVAVVKCESGWRGKRQFLFPGGHSLLGTQLLTRISQSFGVELSSAAACSIIRPLPECRQKLKS